MAEPAATEEVQAGNEQLGQVTSYATAANGEWKNKPVVGNAISSSAAKAAVDTSFRFVRTADLRFRVKDVVHATLGIEDIVGRHGGWVAHTVLKSDPESTDVIPVSEDSSLEVSRYTLTNAITLRVPNEELDSTIRQIGQWVDLFDHRTIDAEDIRFQLLANSMAQRRARDHAGRLANAIDAQGKRLKETLPAEEALLANDEQRDQKIIDNLELMDRVAYSTVRLDIFQRSLTRKELVPNQVNIDAYRPSLGQRLSGSFIAGWELLEAMINGLLRIWPLVLLIAGASLLVWRKARRVSPKPLPPPLQGAQ